MSKSEQQQLSILKPENSIDQEPVTSKGIGQSLFFSPVTSVNFASSKGSTPGTDLEVQHDPFH
jgi:hypothetical protein